MILKLLLITSCSGEKKIVCRLCALFPVFLSFCITGAAGNWFEFSKKRYIAMLMNIQRKFTQTKASGTALNKYPIETLSVGADISL